MLSSRGGELRLLSELSTLLRGKLLLLRNKLLLNRGSELLRSSRGSELLLGCCGGCFWPNDSKSKRADLWLNVNVGLGGDLLVDVGFSGDFFVHVWHDLGSGVGCGGQANKDLKEEDEPGNFFMVFAFMMLEYWHLPQVAW